MANAQQRGDAVVLLVACAGSTMPTAVSVSSPGWSFEPLGPIIGIANEWAKGADNSTGDWSEYRITADAAGTREEVLFNNANVNGYALTTVTIKPR